MPFGVVDRPISPKRALDYEECTMSRRNFRTGSEVLFPWISKVFLMSSRSLGAFFLIALILLIDFGYLVIVECLILSINY